MSAEFQFDVALRYSAKDKPVVREGDYCRLLEKST
jgi:hypothetical protein